MRKSGELSNRPGVLPTRYISERGTFSKFSISHPIIIFKHFQNILKTLIFPPNVPPSMEHFPPNISLSNSIFKISSSHPIYPHAWNISKVSFPHQLYLRAWNIQGRLKFFRKFLQFGSMTRPLPPNVSPSIDHFKKVHHVKQCFPFQQLKTKVYLRTFNENKCIDFNLFAISLGQ